MNKSPFNNCVSTIQVPDYILGLDENNIEYVIHLGSSYPCLIRINDIIEEDDDDDGIAELVGMAPPTGASDADADEDESAVGVLMMQEDRVG